MKHQSRRILALIMVLLLQLFLLSSASATTATQNGLQVEFTTDKQNYSSGEAIEFSLNLTNNNEQELVFSYNVELPEEVELATAERGVITVGSEETASTSFSVVAPAKGADSVPSTGDSFPLMLAGILFLSAAVVCFVLAKNKKRFMAFMMIFVLFFGMVEPMMHGSALAEETYEEDAYQEEYVEEISEEEMEQIWLEEERRASENLDVVFETEDKFTKSFSMDHNVIVDNKVSTIRINAEISNSVDEAGTVVEKASLAAPKPTVTILGVKRFRVNWKAVSGATHYEVWHKQANGKYIKKTTTTKLTYLTNYGRKGVINTYKVRAIKKSGSTIVSKGSYGTCTCYGMDVPKISSVGHTASSSANVRIRWTAGSFCTGYKIYRSTSGEAGTFKLLGSTTAKSYVDKTRNAYYKVRPYYKSKTGVTYLGPATASKGMKAQYRALIIGQGYSSWSSNRLPGCLNDAKGMKAMLGSMTNPKYRPFDVKLRNDLTSSEILQEIKNSFQRAKAGDVSVFYYSGHGTSSGSMCGINSEYGYDYVTVDQLRQALDAVPGKKIVIMDCCYSGQYINKGLGDDVVFVHDKESADAFNTNIVNGFSSTTARANLATSNYYVLTACSKYQTSAELISSTTRFGAFTYTLLWGSGYDEIDKTFLSSMQADTNKNGKLTLQELYKYTFANVNDLGDMVGFTQSVQVYPLNSSFVCWGK